MKFRDQVISSNGIVKKLRKAHQKFLQRSLTKTGKITLINQLNNETKDGILYLVMMHKRNNSSAGTKATYEKFDATTGDTKQ